MKAKYIRSCGRIGNGTDYVYSYRGYEYMIHDYGWFGTGGQDESLAYQHKEEQERIDNIITMKEKQKNQNVKEFDINEIFDILEWEE